VRVSDALRALHRDADGAAALRTIEGALELDPRSPYARTTRAAVLLASQAVDEAKREVESAFQIRPDAPRRVALAAMHYVERDLDRAVSELHDAIDAYPDYALAYLRLAAVQMDQGSTALAQQSLETAERLDAGIPELPLLWAQYYVVTGDAPMARLRAQAAAERFADLWQTQLMVAQIFRAVDDEQGMRRAVQAALEHVPEAQRGALRQQIEESMGASALAPPTEAVAAAPSGDLQLHLGDAPAPAGGEPALGAGEAAGGPALLMGDPSDYHLLGPDQQLQLHLSD
jgi:tetratricopeptide (TPR) repeat protein